MRGRNGAEPVRREKRRGRRSRKRRLKVRAGGGAGGGGGFSGRFASRSSSASRRRWTDPGSDHLSATWPLILKLKPQHPSIFVDGPRWMDPLPVCTGLSPEQGHCGLHMKKKKNRIQTPVRTKRHRETNIAKIFSADRRFVGFYGSKNIQLRARQSSIYRNNPNI